MSNLVWVNDSLIFIFGWTVPLKHWMMLTLILALAVLKHIIIAFDVSSSLLSVTLEGQESHQKCHLLMTKVKSDINFLS